MRRKDAVGRLREVTALDRTTQVLPVPLGGLNPVRRQPSALLRSCRRHQSAALVALAALATGGAVWLSTSPRSFMVEESAGAVRVDGVVLVASIAESRTGGRVFTGQASLALSAVKSGTLTGAAVMTWKGGAATGRCVLHLLSSGASEVCQFASGATRLASADSFDVASRIWHRHYRDGVDITITVPRGSDLIPIPFPLGR
jgi:hypothetical protein